MEKPQIAVGTTVKAPVEKVWQYWNNPDHVKKWNSATSQWHTPSAENDLRKNGRFLYRMEAKDGSAGFDFEGTYNDVDFQKSIAYTLGDGRKVVIEFEEEGDTTSILEKFEAEETHPAEMQRKGWQAILDQFKQYVEQH